MSAYIVSPRTIDYLVQWALNGDPNPDHGAQIPAGADTSTVEYARNDHRLMLRRVDATDLGALLMAENVRSVRVNYSTCAPDDLPGPVDQRRVWRYKFKSVEQPIDPTWVIKSCDCLRYQSCESDNYETTLAYAVLHAIRESAIAVLTDDAPWGVDETHLAQQRKS